MPDPAHRRFVLLGRSYAGRTSLARAIARSLGGGQPRETTLIHYPDGFHDQLRGVSVRRFDETWTLEWAATQVYSQSLFCRARLPGSSAVVLLPFRGLREFDDWTIETDCAEVELLLSSLRAYGVEPFGRCVGWAATQCDRGSGFVAPPSIARAGVDVVKTSARTGAGIEAFLEVLGGLEPIAG